MKRDKKSPVTSDNKKRYIKRVLRTVFLWGIVLSLSMGEMRVQVGFFLPDIWYDS